MRAALAEAVAVAFALTLSTAARAATIVVNSLADPGTTGVCALRDAITAANTMTATNRCAAGTGNDTIRFYVTGTIALSNTLPRVTDSRLTIKGSASPGITIDGGTEVQVLQVASGATLTLNNLTIAHGGNLFSNAGAIVNDGTLTVNNSTVANNQATFAGAILNEETLTVTNSTFSDNSADGGGAIFGGGTMTITNSTFSDNASVTGGGGIANDGEASLKNTIMAGSTNIFPGNIVPPVPASNCSGTIADDGYNISDDTTCGFAKTGSANNGDDVDPLLSSEGLVNNGGPTQTIALTQGSPAIDAIPLADCTDQASPPNRIITDQRGALRPAAGEVQCDIGAYEFQDFAGQPLCRVKSVLALIRQFGSIEAAASALDFPSVIALLNAILTSCGG